MITKYTTLLFDADGTIFDYEKAENDALMASFRHFTKTFADEDIVSGYRLINNELWRQFESGMISISDLRTERFSRLFASLELKLDPQAFGEVYVKYLGECSDLLDDAQNLLDKLYGEFTMALITNGIAEVQKRRISLAGLNKYFPMVVISEEVGSPKPDPIFFEETLTRLNNPPREEILIIGDSLTSDIAGGNLSGISV